jgi:hypothetical protein
VPDGRPRPDPDGATHPGKSKRCRASAVLVAIRKAGPPFPAIHLGDHDAADAPDAARRAWRPAADLRTALGSCTADIEERLARLAHARPAAV